MGEWTGRGARSADSFSRWMERAIAVSEGSPDLFVEWTPVGRITHAWGAVEPLTGYRADELVGRSIADWLHPDDLIELAGRLGGARGMRLVVRASCKQGGEILLEGRATSYGSGAETRHVIVARDFEGSRADEGRLDRIARAIESATGEAFFRRLVEELVQNVGLDSASVGEVVPGEILTIETVAAWGPDGLEPNFRYPLGGTPCERVLAGEMRLYPSGLQAAFPDDPDLVRRNADAYIGTPLLASDGTAIGLLVGMHSLEIRDCERTSAVFRIFAARAAAELERLRANREYRRIAAAFEQSEEAIAIFDVRGEIGFANPAWERYARDTLGGASDSRELLEALTHVESPAREEITAAIPNRRRWRGRYRIATATFEGRMEPLLDASGAFSGGLIATRDVTHEANLENEVQAGRRLEALGQLAGGVAHDFNNLLTGILGHAEILEAGGENAHAVQEAAHTIRRAAERGAALTRQLLGFAGRSSLERAPVDLHALVHEVHTLLRPLLPGSIQLRSELRASEAWVFGDGGQLEQVLLNLALNARDSMPDGGELTFSTARGDRPRTVELCVRDTGSGIPPDAQAHIFEPFFTTKAEGTGMGLSIVYGIVRGHGGVVELHSSERGSEFKIRLPVTNKTDRDAEHARQVTVGSGRLLVADDDPAVRSVTADMLEALGYDVVLAEGGAETIDRYRASHFDLALVDYDMPDVTGATVYRTLHADGPVPRVVLFTAYGESDELDSLRELGLAGVLPKPFRLADLSAAVTDALEIHRATA